MIFNILFEQIALDFIDAWNQKDFDKMESFFTSEIVFKLPTVRIIYPNNQESILRGSGEVMQFMKLFMAQAKDVQFEKQFTEFSKVGRTMNMYGTFKDSGIVVIAKYLLTEYGKFSKIEAEYPNH